MSKKEEKKSKATKTTSNNSLTINEEELKKLNKLTKGSFIWLCCWNSGQILCAPWDHLLSTASDDAWKQSGPDADITLFNEAYDTILTNVSFKTISAEHLLTYTGILLVGSAVSVGVCYGISRAQHWLSRKSERVRNIGLGWQRLSVGRGKNWGAVVGASIPMFSSLSFVGHADRLAPGYMIVLDAALLRLPPSATTFGLLTSTFGAVLTFGAVGYMCGGALQSFYNFLDEQLPDTTD